jgi:lipoprotein NlpI
MKGAALAVLAIAALAPLMAAPPPQRAEADAAFDQALKDFLAGRIVESVTGFDRVVALVPSAAPQLWQRGIALYYAGRYADCRKQFELHRTVNPNDVENPVWHFLCVSHQESPQKARAALLPVGKDGRRPMPQIYEMFRGELAPQAVLAAAGPSLEAQFYAEAYVGLYYEGTGNLEEGRAHLRNAAAEKFQPFGGYMHRVVQLHPLLTGGGFPVKPPTVSR